MQENFEGKPVLDMTLDGEFRTPPASGAASRGFFPAKLLTGVLIASAAVLGGGLILLLLSFLLPVLLALGIVGGLVFGNRVRRSQQVFMFDPRGWGPRGR